jgi:hypothetical protein
MVLMMMFACTVSADDPETKEMLWGRKFEKISKFLNLDLDQQKTIKSIMYSSSEEMGKNKERLTRQKKALIKLDPNEDDYKNKLLELSNETAVLIKEQIMLRGLSREKINDELDADQRKLLDKVFTNIDSKELKRNKFKRNSDEKKSDHNMRKMNDKLDRRLKKKRRDKS